VDIAEIYKIYDNVYNIRHKSQNRVKVS